MLEAMMMCKKKASGVKGQPDVGYNFDTDRSTGKTAIVVANLAGNVVAPPVALAGYSKALNEGNNNFGITPLTAMDVGTGDFTLEFAFYMTNTTSGYSIMFFGDNNGIGYEIRFANSGYGDRLQVTLQPGVGNSNFSVKATRAQLANKWNHIAFQRSKGKVIVYLNGVKQGLAINTGIDYSVSEQPSAQDISGTKTLRFGYSGFAGSAYIPEFAFYKGVKYVADFTPSYPLVK